MKINISKKNLKKKIYVGRKNSAKKNFIVQSLANMIFIHNILTSYEDDSCFNKRIPLEWFTAMLRMLPISRREF